jgi:hypothetical protein
MVGPISRVVKQFLGHLKREVEGLTIKMAASLGALR